MTLLIPKEHQMTKFTSLFILLLFFFHNAVAQGPSNALDFDGNDDYINIPDNAILNPAGDFSAEVWFKSRSISTWQGVVTKLTDVNGNTGDGWNIQVGTAQNIASLMSDDSGNWVYLKTSWAPETDVWYHVVLVHKNSSNTNELYVNGKLEATNTHAISFTNNPVQVGKFYTNAGSLFFDGQIDGFRYWNKALTQADIRNNMCQKINPADADLIAYYRFDETGGSTLPDLTANSNDGTLTNMDGNTDWITSGAPIGDASAHSYPAGADWTGKSLELTSTNRGNLKVRDVSGSPDGIHIYQVQEKPNTEAGIDQDLGNNNIYYGTFVVNGASPTYTVDYNYDNYQGAKDDEDFLKLYKRGDNEKSPWADAGATLDKPNSLLTKTGISARSEFVINSTNAPLPVELLYFVAKKQKEGFVELTWATASEKNNDHFLLQSSKDGKIWSNVTTIEGAGNSTAEKKYQYVDSPSFYGTIYYRLQQTDFDGGISFSQIKSVDLSTGKPDITIYPNPVSEILTILTNTTAKIDEIVLYNGFGSVVYQHFGEVKKIDVAQFPEGIYFLEVTTFKGRFLNKIIIR